jgi:glycosyltransferase involved in cell wall biosynthesis
MRPPRVDILLATYNGEQFIERQIESVLDQMDPRCRLLIRDDGSSDATMSIVQRFVTRWPERITVLEDRERKLGACRSFSRLVEHSDADYLVYCDQDDVWLPGRIAKPLERVQEIERDLGANVPLLVHTDLVVVDESLNTLAPSFWSYSNLRPEQGKVLNRLLVQNVVTGCASMINRALARLVSASLGVAVPMHDWWVALIAAAFGQIHALPDATVLYRQHGENCVGAKRYDWRYAANRGREVLFGNGVRRRLHVSQRQARLFLERFGQRLNPGHRAMLDDFLRLEDAGLINRRRLLIKHRFFGSGRLRNLAWLAMI